mgnify:CR=1 FL=1
MTEKSAKKNSLSDLKLYGAPWYITVIGCIVVIAAAWLGALGTDFSSTMILIIAYGILFFELGERLPIWNTYIGGGVLAAFFGTAIIRQLSLIPEMYLDPINEFIGGDTVGFTTIWIIILITGSVLSLEKKILLKSFVGYFPAILGGLVAAMVLIYGVRSAVQYQGNQKMQEVFQQQEMTDAKNVTGAQQGEKETDTVSKIETTQNSENEVVSDEKAGSSEISKESNSESAVQDTEASETQTTEKTQQTWGSIGGYYTVKRGDTLAGISKKMYQSYNYIEMIAEANGIDNVDEIYPGQILEIPQIED